jgi:hypothetical protein
MIKDLFVLCATQQMPQILESERKVRRLEQNIIKSTIFKFKFNHIFRIYND